VSRSRYRVAVQLDRSWCVGDDGEPDFEDPDEVATDEIEFAAEGETHDADDRATAAMTEISAAIDAILKKHGFERPEASAARGA
jgi:hypothetical protein